VVVRFFNASGSQVGSDAQFQLAVAGSLMAITIRPQEIVALRTLSIPGSTADAMRSYRVFPAWNDVRCP
jgi:hypothetical protein